MRPIAPVVRQEVPIQSVEHDDDRFHRDKVYETEEVQGFQRLVFGKSTFRSRCVPQIYNSSEVHT